MMSYLESVAVLECMNCNGPALKI